MLIRYPEYYHRFRCIAGACPDSCCKEWAVAVDPETAALYQDLPGALGDALRDAMTEEDGDILLTLTENKRCPMWRADGLCRIQAEMGESYLCSTCAQFPRLVHDYGTFQELGLELSCPEAAQLILSHEPAPMVEQEKEGGCPPEYAQEDMDLLLRSRQAARNLLGDPRFSPGQALAILLLYGCDVQNELDGGESAILDPETDLRRAKSLAQKGDADAFLDVYRQLNILTPNWKSRLENPLPGRWLPLHKAMAGYLTERYWLQAISDLDLFARVKLIVASCLAVKLLGGDPLQTAQQYSKEIENDAENVDSLLDAAYLEPAFADIRLLDLLL